MGRKLIASMFILSLVFIGISQISCNQVYVKVLPSVPIVKEIIRVYGLAPWTGEQDPSQLRLLENSSKADAQAITATLASGMKFNYRFNKKAEVSVEQYNQSTWAELHNFKVKYRDLVDAGQNKFIMSTADVSLVYDINEENYNEMKKGIGVETRVSMKPGELLSLNQVVSNAVQQAVKELYADKHDVIEGSVWVIKVLPEFNVSGSLSKNDMNRYLSKGGKYVPKSSNSMDFLVTLVIRKDYIPAIAGNTGVSSNFTEISGVINTNVEDGLVLPGFAFEEQANRETAKQKSKARAEKFADYISRGFEYKGEVFSPRKDREKGNIIDYSFSTQPMVGGDSRNIIIGKAIIKTTPFEKPLVKPSRIELKQVFQLENTELLEKVLDNLPSLLVVKAIKTYGSSEGMGYFGNQFNWRVYVNENTKNLEFEITCDVYMHIKPYNKKY